MGKKKHQKSSQKRGRQSTQPSAPARPVHLDKRLLRTALIAAVVYAVIMSAFSVSQHLNLRTQMADLGNADQAIWAASRGDLAMTVSNDSGGQLRSRLGIHANIFFWFLAPLYLVFSNPAVLLVLTSVATAAAGFGLFLIARHLLGKENPWTLVPLFAFYLNPMVQDANLYDFHIITVSTALLVFSIWGFETNRRPAAWICLGLAILCKEDVALVAAMLGVYLLLTKRRVDGAVAIGAGVAYLVLFYVVINPLVDEGRSLEFVSGTYARHTWMGASLKEMLWTLVSKPLEVIKVVFAPYHIRLPVYLLLIGGIVGLRSWKILLLTLPYLGVAMTTDNFWMTRITGTYYWMPSVAFIIVACILSAAKTLNKKTRPFELVYLGAAVVPATLLFSPLPHGAYSTWANYAQNPHRAEMLAVTRDIPEDAALCFQNNLAPHFSQRPDIVEQGPRCNNADYLLFHLKTLGGPDFGMFYRSSFWLYRRHDKNARTMEKLIKGRWFGLIKHEKRFWLFKKGAHHVIPEKEALEQLKADARAAMKEQNANSDFPWIREYLNGDWK